jgi:hypothetical protein
LDLLAGFILLISVYHCLSPLVIDGLVFGFHTKPNLSDVAQYDNYTQAKYAQLADSLAKYGGLHGCSDEGIHADTVVYRWPKQRQQHHPIGYFELDERDRRLTVELDYKTHFKYACA